jgi:predicted metal-binding protein
MVEVLGPGCPSCDQLYQNVLEAVEQIHLNERVMVKKRKDIEYFKKMGVAITPGLVIDGEVVSKGKVLTVDRIVDILKSQDHKDNDDVLESLIQVARQSGASDAKVVSTTAIAVDASLTNFCKDSRCKNYGLSINCPPHVSGPTGFKEMLKDCRRAVVFKINVPTETLLSENHMEVFRSLHKIAANIEHAAVEKGFNHSKAFAGGSCKSLFCQDRSNCVVLSEKGNCYHPHIARPSMSGFGVNVSELVKAVGWQMDRITSETDPNAVNTGMLCGLVLIG